MSRFPLLLTAAAALVLVVGCKPAPSDSYVANLKTYFTDRCAKDSDPSFRVTLGTNDGNAFDLNGNQKLRGYMEALGNNMGFRIEASQVRQGFLTVPRYALTGFNAPTLPGVTFKNDGKVVTITPDYRAQMTIESILPPEEGFAAARGKALSGAQRDQQIAAAKVLGLKDAKSAVDADIAANKEGQAEAAKKFAESVQRVCKDNSYKRAWYVSYRVKESTTVPKDSPFWKLVDAFLELKGTSDKVLASPFWRNHGEPDLKATLEVYNIVAFEGQDGKVAKTEPWTVFVGN